MKIAVWGKTSASYLRVILLWKLKDVASKIRNSKASKPYSTKRERRDKIIKQVSDCARARACVCVVFCLSFPSFSFSAASSSSSSSALSSTSSSSSSSSSSFSSRYSNSDNVNASNKIATRRLVKEKLKQRARARERLFFSLAAFEHLRFETCIQYNDHNEVLKRKVNARQNDCLWKTYVNYQLLMEIDRIKLLTCFSPSLSLSRRCRRRLSSSLTTFFSFFFASK